MRPSDSDSLLPLAATAIAGFIIAASILISPTTASADEPKAQPGPQSGAPTCSCPEQRTSPWVRPKYAELTLPMLSEFDEIAALESVQFGLSEVGDGGTYTWQLNHGRLSGIVQPTSSFKDGNGKVCRHVVVSLTSGSRTAKTEGVACRLDNGQWQLEG